MFHKFNTKNDKVLGKMKYELVKEDPLRDEQGKKIRGENGKVKKSKNCI